MIPSSPLKNKVMFADGGMPVFSDGAVLELHNWLVQNLLEENQGQWVLTRKVERILREGFSDVLTNQAPKETKAQADGTEGENGAGNGKLALELKTSGEELSQPSFNQDNPAPSFSQCKCGRDKNKHDVGSAELKVKQ